MPATIPVITEKKVEPGDLITAGDMNYVFSALLNLQQQLDALKARVAVLEASGVVKKVAIYSVTPSGILTVNQPIVVYGANFSAPAANNYVTVGGIQVTTFTPVAPAQATSQLAFNVPSIPNLAAGGSDVVLSVTNASGSSATFPLKVKSAVLVPHGSIGIVYSAAPITIDPSGNITKPGGCLFTFTVTPDFSGAASILCRLEPVLNHTGWEARVRLAGVGSWQNTLDLNIPQNDSLKPFDVAVYVVIPPTASQNSAVLRLEATEKTTNTKVNPGQSQDLNLVVGQKPPTPEERVYMYIRDSGGAIILENGEAIFKTATGIPAGDLNLTLEIKKNDENKPVMGTYIITPSLTDTTGWQAPTIAGQPSANYTLNTELPVGQSRKHIFSVKLIPQAGAVTGDTDLKVRITNPGRGVDIIYRVRIKYK